MMKIWKLASEMTLLLLMAVPAPAEGEGRSSLYDMAVGQLGEESAAADGGAPSERLSEGAASHTDENGMTALMRASREGNDWTLRLLLESGADVNARDREGWTALMYAVRYQNSRSIVSLLIDHGASVRVRNLHNATPLLIAASYNQNPDVISLLLQDRSGAEEEVFNAFILAIEDEASSPLVKEAKLDVFFKKGIPVNGYFRGLTPLMYACKYNSSSLAANRLLERGADASMLGKEDKRALDYALENPSFPHDRVFRTLLGGKDS